MAQPLAGYARGDRATGAAGGNFRAPIVQHAPASAPGGSGGGNPYAKPAVARALRALRAFGLDAPAAPAALDNTPAGSEFQVNTYTTRIQLRPSVAMDADGDFVVVWTSGGSGGTDTSGFSIQAQRFLSSNTAAATPTPTSTSTPTSTVTPQPPTAVDLRYFRAIGLADRAILVWETASEADTLGFQVLRAADPGGPWTPVGPALIPAEGGAATGRTYVLRDAPGPGTWHYRVEDVGADGKRSRHPAADVRVGPGATGSELFVPSAKAERR